MNFDAITNKTAAYTIAHAVLASHSHDEIWSSLRFHRRTQGVDFTGFLIGSASDVDDPGDFDTISLDSLKNSAATFLGE